MSAKSILGVDTITTVWMLSRKIYYDYNFFYTFVFPKVRKGCVFFCLAFYTLNANSLSNPLSVGSATAISAALSFVEPSWSPHADTLPPASVWTVCSVAVASCSLRSSLVRYHVFAFISPERSLHRRCLYFPHTLDC